MYNPGYRVVQKGVAIRLGTDDEACPYGPAATTLVLDDDLLSQNLRQSLRCDARHQIDPAASCQGDHDANRSRWEIALRVTAWTAEGAPRASNEAKDVSSMNVQR